MPRNARVIAPGLPYHITQRGTNRQRVFFTSSDRSLYLRLIRENLEDSGTRILAYCLMTNHVHFVVIPTREDSLSTLFGRANGRYAQALNIRQGRSGHFWQPRFHSCPMSDSHFWVGLRYVEANPCRANMVTSPADYPWSSAAVHLNASPDRTRILDLDFWVRAGGAPRVGGPPRQGSRPRPVPRPSQMHLCRSSFWGAVLCGRNGRPLSAQVAPQDFRRCLLISKFLPNRNLGCPATIGDTRGCSGCRDLPPPSAGDLPTRLLWIQTPRHRSLPQFC